MSVCDCTKQLHGKTLQITNQQAFIATLQQIVEVSQAQMGTSYAAISLPDWGANGYTFVQVGVSAETASSLPHTPHHLGLLGRVLDQSEPVIIDDITTEPNLRGFPNNHPIMSSFIGVAILNGSEPLGALYLSDKLDGSPFNDADRQLVELFAGHAAIAIEQYRLRLQARQLAALQEQHNVSLTLHDGAIQSLFAVSLTLHTLVDELEGKSIDAQTLTASSLSNINQVINALRQFMTDAVQNGV